MNHVLDQEEVQVSVSPRQHAPLEEASRSQEHVQQMQTESDAVPKLLAQEATTVVGNLIVAVLLSRVNVLDRDNLDVAHLLPPDLAATQHHRFLLSARARVSP